MTVFNLWPCVIKLFGLYAIESLNWEQVFAQRCQIGSQMKQKVLTDEIQMKHKVLTDETQNIHR